MSTVPTFESLPAQVSALAVDLDDPETERVRAAIAQRLLGETAAPVRVGRFVVLDRLGAGGMGVVYCAFDPELDRKVAVKLLFERDRAPAEQERLLREARAMAKLAHPNVVSVYEVGEHRGQVFVAMEWIRGQTLRTWWTERQRSWKEILAVCRQAGEGLAAAHAAGMVHRDFKPDNVMVGDDGRVRVLDFGLARTLPETLRSPSSAEETPTERTMSQHAVGTLGYLAPEVLRGDPAGTQSDQFALCATLWEALTGSLPFPPRAPAIALEAMSAELAAPRPGAMPKWVERALRRGLGPAPRYASVSALLAELGRDPARIWIRGLGATAIGVGIGAAFLVGASLRESSPAEDPCPGAEQILQEVWPTDERTSTFGRIEAMDTAYARVLAPRLAASIEGYADRWRDGYRDACLTHARGEQSADLLDRRMICLHRGRVAVATLRASASDVEPARLPDLALAVASLPAPEACAELEAMAAAPRATAAQSERAAEVATLYTLGRFDDALAKARALVADAREVGDPGVLAEALLLEARVLLEVHEKAAGAALLREAVEAAFTAGADEIAVEAWGHLAWATSTNDTESAGEPPEGRAIILAVASRLSGRVGPMSLYNNLAMSEPYASDRVAARELLQRGLALSTTAGHSGRSLRATLLVNLANVEDDPTARGRLLAEATAEWAAIAGPEHPRTLRARGIQAVDLPDLHRSAQELSQICAEYGRFHPELNAAAVGCDRQLALVSEMIGDRDGSIAATERWAAAAKPGEPMPAGMLALRRGDAVNAATLLQAAVDQYAAMPSRRWWENVYLAEAELALGRAWRALGRADADAMLRTALRRLEGDGNPPRPPAVARSIAFARGLLDGSMPPPPRIQP